MSRLRTALRTVLFAGGLTSLGLLFSPGARDTGHLPGPGGLPASRVFAGSAPADAAVFDTTRPLRFHHRCSEPAHSGDAYWQAYAFFDTPRTDTTYKALALGKVLVGWVSGPGGEQGVGFRLEKMRLVAPTWAGAEFGLALQLVHLRTKAVITGPQSATFYQASSHRPPQEQQYGVSATGSVDWEQFHEPEADAPSERTAVKHATPLVLDSAHLPRLDDAYALRLVVENRTTHASLILHGPVVEDLRARLQIDRPQFRILGFFQTLNPFQKGGLWDALTTAWRYKDCVQLRKQAKAQFRARFAQR